MGYTVKPVVIIYVWPQWRERCNSLKQVLRPVSIDASNSGGLLGIICNIINGVAGTEKPDQQLDGQTAGACGSQSE